MNAAAFTCFIKIRLEGREEECGRPRKHVKDLCCQDHWKLVPKPLRQALIAANKVMSMRERERLTINAATAVVDYLKGLRVQLPPAPKLQLAEGLSGGAPLGSLVKVDAGPQVRGEKKLIIGAR